jgi:hypothetical protein
MCDIMPQLVYGNTPNDHTLNDDSGPAQRRPVRSTNGEAYPIACFRSSV